MLNSFWSKRRFIVFSSILYCGLVFGAPKTEAVNSDSALNQLPEETSLSDLGKADEGVLEMIPAEEKLLKIESAVLNLKTNVSGAEVYINGLYVGRTDLTLKDLASGMYLVEVKKTGYENERFWVNLKAGNEYTYEIKMKLIVGFVEISGLPKKVEIHLDNAVTKLSNSNGNYRFETVPGTHKLVIRSFGFAEETCTVEVRAYETVNLEVSMKECEFEMKDFSVSKNKINPKYTSKLGNTEFYFTVTASNPVKFYICNDREEVVYEKEWQEFDKWLQIVKWNGRDNNEKVLPDGLYVAHLESEHFIFNQNIEIISTDMFPIFNINKNGTGIGTLPALFASFNDKDIVENADAAYFDIKALKGISGYSKENGTYVMSADVGVDLNWAHTEVYFGTAFFPFYESNYLSFYTGLKLRFYKHLENNLDFSYGGLVRYGITSEGMYETVSFDTGNGLDFGLLCGLENKWFNLGFSSQYIFAAGSGRLGKNSEEMKTNIWENGLTLKIQPVSWLSLNGWTALNNLKALEVGGGVTVMPMSASLMMDLNCNSYLIFKDCTYFDFGFVLSYLF